MDQKDSTQKFKLCIKQYGTESVQKNSSSKTYFSVLLKHVKKNLKKIRHTEDEKFQLQLESQLIRSYRIRMKNQTVHRLRAGIKSQNRNSNFFKPKWVKLGTLLKISETKLRKRSLATDRKSVV